MLLFSYENGEPMKYIKVVLSILSIAVVVVFLYIEKQLSGLNVAISIALYFLVMVIHMSSHEIGHLAGGLLSGYRLLHLRIGPMNIVKKREEKAKVVWKKNRTGHCIMIPLESEPVKYFAYNIGGIVANFLVVTVSFTLLLLNSFYVSLLFLELVIVGLYKILINLIPHKTNAIPNDGYVISLLRRSKDTQKDYAIYLNLYEKVFWDEPICKEDYIYGRKTSTNVDEMLYYDEIRSMLCYRQ